MEKILHHLNLIFVDSDIYGDYRYFNNIDGKTERQTINNFVFSMPTRVNLVIKSSGKPPSHPKM